MLLLRPAALPMLPFNLCWSQIARGVLQHLAAVTGGELDGFESEIDLEDLLETYGLSLPDCRECESLHTQCSVCWLSVTSEQSVEVSSAQSVCYLMHPCLLCN